MEQARVSQENRNSEDPLQNNLNSAGNMLSNGHIAVGRVININAEDLEDETKEKLKGDVIGETLYSQSFVLKTLLAFENMKWTEEFEDDLCFLWDMTVERDVCEFLYNHNFPTLVGGAVGKYNESRFKEIIIGILGNIMSMCGSKGISEISDDLIVIILNELNTDDSMVLIQVARFISALAYNLESLCFFNDELLSRLYFILNNNTNNELILKTLEAVAKITSDFKIDVNIINPEIINAILTASEMIENIFEIDTKEKTTAIKLLLEILTNICAYINKYSENDNIKALQLFILENNILNQRLTAILRNFNSKCCEIFDAIPEEFQFYISAICYIFRILDTKYNSENFILISQILYNVTDDTLDILNNVLELFCFYLYKGNRNTISADFQKLPKEHHGNILKKVETTKCEFDFNYESNFNYLLETLNKS